MLIIKVLILMGFFLMCLSKDLFMPNLPLGEYRTVFDKIYHCETTKIQLNHFNLHFNKITSTTTEIKGNFSLSIPYDDTLTIDLNFASWGSTGGWKPNSYVYITKNACSKSKIVFGNAWISLMKSINVSTSCPIPAGTYTLPGIDLKVFEDHNFPKVYFYGKYKAVSRLKNVANELLGCLALEFSLIRPWEKPI